jgi:hypothetical protein
MEIALAVVMCGLFGYWIWNLKANLVNLKNRVFNLREEEDADIRKKKVGDSSTPSLKRSMKIASQDNVPTWIIK